MGAKLTSILSLPAGYRFFTRLVGGNVWRVHTDEHIHPRGGDKVLDIGCGPADILDYLPKVDYLGFDISEEYIEAARMRHGSRGRFFCSDVGLASIEKERGTFDLVLATGVIHHLDDARAASLFKLAKMALSPKGRLVTYDGCYEPGQSPIARWLLHGDRGKFVRTREAYQQLAGAVFSKVEVRLRHDLLRVPYTHLIMCCSSGTDA